MEIKVPATAVDIYRMLPEGTRCEVIFNELSMSPSPTTEHQYLSAKLTAALFNFLTLADCGVVYAGPIDVYFENLSSAVQPDLLVILNENKNIIKKDGIYGSPDVIIEILSSNHLYDTVKKKELYEKAGIKEYFIIGQNKTVTLFTLNSDKQYQLVYEENGILKSDVLGCNLNF